jgi:hypothetical protein
VIQKAVDVLARLVRWLGSRPAAQLVLGALVVTFAFPATPAAAIGRTILAGALGVAVALAWPHVPEAIRSPNARVASRIVLGAIVVAGLLVFWDTMTEPVAWQVGDWGPQHAVLAHLMPSLPGFDAPVWNHAVGTGDAPLELYPALTYYVTGHVAWLLGLEDQLPQAFMIVATFVHVGLALATTALAMRVAPKPLALLVGLLFLVDSGAISHGGTVGLFHWALLHSALAHAFSMIAALGILAALRRPRLGASVAIWLGIAVSTAAHPVALITAAAYVLALAVVAVLAADVPPRRALVAIAHVVLGVALGAAVWMPATERLLAYGQHFPNELYTPVKLLQTVMAYAMPITAYAPIVYAGYFGILTGAWTRRAELIFISLVGLVLLVGLADAPYLAFGLAPSQTVARLGAMRMMLLARPFVFAAAAFALSILYAHARAAWLRSPRRSRLVAAAALGVVALPLVRVLPEYWRAETDRAYQESRQVAPDPFGRMQLVWWARGQMQSLGPTAYARALFEEDTHEHFHLTAETGLPTFHLDAQPDLLLRERIEDTTPASLKRFDVKWVIAVGHSPSLGDPASEIELGTYHIRTLPDWDGQFARVERGYGTVEVTRLDDRAVEVNVTGPGPSLVALGTGYYPRWRATHASGADEPVYALPATAGGTMHVVSAWLAPGHTTFTCDGPLPSDGHGRTPTFAAAFLAIAAIVCWRRRHWRLTVLRGFARARGWLRGRAATAVEWGVPLAIAVLYARGCAEHGHRTPALLVGSGLRASATVEARAEGGDWQTCGYSPVTGVFRCDDLATVSDTTTNLVNDATPSWSFITPAISASLERDDVDLRITLDAHLSGTYWSGSTFDSATLHVPDDIDRELGDHSQQRFDDRGLQPLQLVLRASNRSDASFTLVAEESLVPARDDLDGPPLFPPPAVLAIR